MNVYTVTLEHDTKDVSERKVIVLASNEYDAMAAAQIRLNGSRNPLSGWQPVQVTQ